MAWLVCAPLCVFLVGAFLRSGGQQSSDEHNLDGLFIGSGFLLFYGLAALAHLIGVVVFFTDSLTNPNLDKPRSLAIQVFWPVSILLVPVLAMGVTTLFDVPSVFFLVSFIPQIAYYLLEVVGRPYGIDPASSYVGSEEETSSCYVCRNHVEVGELQDGICGECFASVEKMRAL